MYFYYEFALWKHGGVFVLCFFGHHHQACACMFMCMCMYSVICNTRYCDGLRYFRVEFPLAPPVAFVSDSHTHTHTLPRVHRPLSTLPPTLFRFSRRNCMRGLGRPSSWKRRLLLLVGSGLFSVALGNLCVWRYCWLWRQHAHFMSRYLAVYVVANLEY